MGYIRDEFKTPEGTPFWDIYGRELEAEIRKLINKELDRREREAPEQGSFLKSGFSWDFNFWFDRDSWGHRCYPSGRTVELRIDRSNCPACGIERPDTAPERKHTQPVGTVVDRGQDEHGFWFTVKLDDDHWQHSCTYIDGDIIWRDPGIVSCFLCGMERPGN